MVKKSGIGSVRLRLFLLFPIDPFGFVTCYLSEREELTGRVARVRINRPSGSSSYSSSSVKSEGALNSNSSRLESISDSIPAGQPETTDDLEGLPS